MGMASSISTNRALAVAQKWTSTNTGKKKPARRPVVMQVRQNGQRRFAAQVLKECGTGRLNHDSFRVLIALQDFLRCVFNARQTNPGAHHRGP
jgi:hypothetical protein